MPTRSWRLKNPEKYQEHLDRNRASKRESGRKAYAKLSKEERQEKYRREVLVPKQQDPESWYKKTKELSQLKVLRACGMSLKEAREYFITLDTKCSICSSTENLCIDHCHETLTVRGRLCKKCNIALGMFGDNIELLQKAIKYLTKTG